MTPPARELRADSPAADILLKTEKMRFLTPFLTAPRSVAQAAKLCGVSGKRMQYWVNLLEVSGLIEQSGQDASTRGAVYRAVGTSFIVKNLDAMVMEDHHEQQFDPLWRSFKLGLRALARQEADSWHLLVSLDQDNTVVRRFVPAWITPGDPLTVDVREVNTWAHLPLTRRQAAQLKKDLDELMERYVRLAQEPQPEPWTMMLVHLGLVPKVDEE